jgi:four helix bundle protein
VLVENNVIKDRSFKFALRIVRLYRYIKEEKKEYVLSKQVLRSGTAIGALVRESQHAESKADFIHKLSIALKEANETDYWIELLFQSGYLEETSYLSIHADIDELLKLLISIIKTTKANK